LEVQQTLSNRYRRLQCNLQVLRNAN
jgi:hypothetical protein